MHKIGIVYCNRMNGCPHTFCKKALYSLEGSFAEYINRSAHLVGFSECNFCTTGDLESSVSVLYLKGATTIHFSTCLVTGFPPCPYINKMSHFIRENLGITFRHGTHPISNRYYKLLTKNKLPGIQIDSPELSSIMAPRKIRKKY